LSAESDRTDVRRVLDGDVEAFAGIVERWQGPLIQLAYRYSGDRAAAEDMAQEAFVRVYRQLSKWRGEGKFSTWLFAVAINGYRSWLRRRRPPALPIEKIPEPADSSDPMGEFEGAEEARRVRDEVRQLPEKYRDALTLFYFHEMNVESAAASLGIPEGTLKSLLHRGRKLLEQKLLSSAALRTQEGRRWTRSTERSSTKTA
jgi:RNA polymerase sigma-70 factor (ECF subfamily)